MKKILTSLALGVALCSTASAVTFIDTSFEGALPSGFPGTYTETGLDGVGGAASFASNTFTGYDFAAGSLTTAIAAGSFDFSLRIDSLSVAGLGGATVQGLRVMFFSNATSTNAGFGINADYNANTDTFTVWARIGTTQSSTGITVAPGSLITGSVIFDSSAVADLIVSNTNALSVTSTSGILDHNFTTNDTTAANIEGNRIVFRSPNANSFNVTPGNTNGAFIVDDLYAGTSAVPEPSSFAALAGLGALGFAALRRRRA
jgi:hypothetical protein